MTQSLEDYIETIYVLIGENRPAQVRDVAKLLNVKMPSVVLRSLLVKLGVNRRIADRDACLMEHILSAETLEKIREYTEKNK